MLHKPLALLFAVSACYGAAWPEARPQDEGLDAAMLEQGSAWLVKNKPASASLLVARHGRLVFERYYGGATREQAGNVKSINKSVLSALAGIALADGRIASLDQPVARYLPALPDAQVRIRHLLTMTAGLQWEENGPITRAWYSNPDPNRFALSQPRVAPPGEKFEYSTALTHLLSTVLTRATGQSSLDYATSRLFKPLGIASVRWDRLAGIQFGGAEFYITPRDLARFGQLYLQQGRWKGRQVVPAAWVVESTSPQGGDFYGYLWWIYNVQGRRLVCASGVWGQHLCLVPSLDLLVVHTSREAEGREASIAALQVIRRFILPSAGSAQQMQRPDSTSPVDRASSPAAEP